MLRANVWLVNGESLGSFDLDAEYSVETLRAQVESKLQLSNFHEVKLFRYAGEGQELTYADEVLEDIEVQAVLVVSLTKAAEMLENVVHIAAKERRQFLLPTVDAFIDTFVAVESLQAGEKSRRLLQAMLLATHPNYMSVPDRERMGNVFGRLCKDYTFFLDALIERLFINSPFAVPAIARMVSRQECSTMKAHADIISRNLVDAFSSNGFHFFAVASDSTLADAIQLLATFGADEDLVMLAMLAAQFAHRDLEACDSSAAPRLQLFLEQLRALLEAKASRTSCS